MASSVKPYLDSPSRQLKARIDISKASVLGEVNLGDTITVQIRGKVAEMRGENQYYMEPMGKPDKGKKTTIPGELVLEIAKFEVDPQEIFDDPGEDA